MKKRKKEVLKREGAGELADLMVSMPCSVDLEDSLEILGGGGGNLASLCLEREQPKGKKKKIIKSQMHFLIKTMIFHSGINFAVQIATYNSFVLYH